MIRRSNEQAVRYNENMRGGEGCVQMTALITPEEMYKKGRLFSKITLPPGASIGYHVHEKEMETFYIIAGECEYDDNGQTTRLLPGDVAYTPAGNGHSVKNAGEVNLEMLALIVLE